MVVLSKRMESVVSLLTPGLFVTDIGCDHAYVSIYLIQSGRSRAVIAMDVRKGPLEIAEKNVRAAGLLDEIELRLSDGGKELKVGEVQAAVIAGMGGMLMERILDESSDVFCAMDELVLQPQSDLFHFRKFLYERGYVIEKEDMVIEDGKYYPMMRVVRADKGTQMQIKLSDEEYTYGPYLLEKRNEVLHEFLLQEREKKQEILASLNRKADKKDKMVRRIDELSRELMINENALSVYR